MKIRKTDSSYVTSRIIDYIERVTNKTNDDIFRKSFDYILELFTCKIEFDTITIDCTEEDVDFLLYDYIKTLSQKHHLAIFVFVDGQVNIETVNKLKRLGELTEYLNAIPTGLYDDRIKLNIGFSQAYSVRNMMLIYLQRHCLINNEEV